MIKESRLHEQLQASLEKGERLVELTLESEQEAVTAKISYVGKEDFWHSNLHHLLKEKGTFNLSLSRKQFNHKIKRASARQVLLFKYLILYLRNLLFEGFEDFQRLALANHLLGSYRHQ